MSKSITAELTRDEALVLFELLARWQDSGELRFEHQSEERALMNLRALLERQLVEPFGPNYKEILQQSQERLRDR